MSFISKIKGAVSNVAKQGVQIISEISKDLMAPDSIPSFSNANAKQDLIILYKDLISFIDELANDPDAERIESSMKLSQSPVREILKRIIYLLQVESKQWMDLQRKSILSFKKMEDIEIPCIEYVLQENVIQSIILRCVSDTPRGLLPLILSALSYLFHHVEYPLLPHQSVYKSVAKLISFATRYDAMMIDQIYSDRDSYLSYKRRISKSLVPNGFHYDRNSLSC
jgi:hypothetical protein